MHDQASTPVVSLSGLQVSREILDNL